MSNYFRSLATGGASCEPTDAAGPSGSAQNPMSRLANTVLGDRGKHAREQQLRAMENQGTYATRGAFEETRSCVHLRQSWD